MIKINVQIIKKTFQLDKQGLLIQMKRLNENKDFSENGAYVVFSSITIKGSNRTRDEIFI